MLFDVPILKKILDNTKKKTEKSFAIFLAISAAVHFRSFFLDNNLAVIEMRLPPPHGDDFIATCTPFHKFGSSEYEKIILGVPKNIFGNFGRRKKSQTNSMIYSGICTLKVGIF